MRSQRLLCRATAGRAVAMVAASLAVRVALAAATEQVVALVAVWEALVEATGH